MNIAIVGLGLIGGSAARALKAYTSHNVYGEDKNKQTELYACSCGAIDAILTEERLSACDIVFLALYPQAAVSYLRAHASYIKKDAIVVDFCGVKRAVFSAMHDLAQEFGFTYIGGHPMAGREYSGFSYASEDLFSNASMILTPPDDVSAKQLSILYPLFSQMRFQHIQLSTPEEHDHIIAYTSQLAHVLSSAYVKSPSALVHKGFSAGSFRDMTRVARLNETMWTELFLENADYLSEEIEGLAQRLLLYADAIKKKDTCTLHALLKEGRIRKEEVEGETTIYENSSHSCIPQL